MELTECRRFGSSGLALTSEGLLLVVSLCILTECTCSDARQLGFWIANTLGHAKGIFVVFCRKLKVFGASTWRLRWINGAEAHVTTRADAESWRLCATHQLMVAHPCDMRQHAIGPLKVVP
jgi:hypothetical protein